MDARPLHDCTPAGPLERPGATRCPSCGSLTAREASWCSLCHHDLRAPAHPSDDDDVAAAADPQDRPGALCGEQLSLDLGVDLGSLDRDAGRHPEAAAAQLLAELAVTEQRWRVPASLSFLADGQSPGTRVAVGVAGVLLFTALGLLSLAVLGFLL